MHTIESYWNPEAGLRSDVLFGGRIYTVRLVDTDCNETLPSVRKFVKEDDAHTYARKLVSWC